MAPRPRKLSRRQKLIAFAPALVVGCMTAFVASGASIVPGATASSVNISGTVGGSVITDATPTGAGCPDVAGTRTFDVGSSWYNTPVTTFGAGVCTIAFRTNGGSGAEVRMQNANAADPATQVFCNDPSGAAPRDCASGNVDNVSGTGQTLSGGADRFGIALVDAAGAAGNAAGAGVGGIEDATPNAADASWAPIPDNGASTVLCATTGPNPGADATCDFAIGVHGEGAGQASGAYSAAINFATQTL
jgi:hypothetical protein